jgi:hypothetical protein
MGCIRGNADVGLNPIPVCLSALSNIDIYILKSADIG